jgi:hypothetical protein
MVDARTQTLLPHTGGGNKGRLPPRLGRRKPRRCQSLNGRLGFGEQIDRNASQASSA